MRPRFGAKNVRSSQLNPISPSWQILVIRPANSLSSGRQIPVLRSTIPRSQGFVKQSTRICQLELQGFAEWIKHFQEFLQNGKLRSESISVLEFYDIFLGIICPSPWLPIPGSLPGGHSLQHGELDGADQQEHEEQPHQPYPDWYRGG